MNIILKFSIFTTLIVQPVHLSVEKLRPCVTIPCVRSTASILEKFDASVDPCDDFWQFACGTFVRETFTADEDSTVDTISSMTDQLYEFILTLLDDQEFIEKKEIFGKVKTFYDTCLDEDSLESRATIPIKTILEKIGGWPLIEDNWTGKTWDLKKSILTLREIISGHKDDIFSGRESVKSANQESQKFARGQDDVGSVRKATRLFIENIALKLGASNDQQLKEDVDNLIIFEESLANYTRKAQLAAFRRIPKDSRERKAFFDLIQRNKLITWLNFFAPSILLNSTQQFTDDELKFNSLDFLQFWNKVSSKRTRANFLGWRIVQASLFYASNDINEVFLDFETKLFGKQDVEQRYQRCLKLIIEKAAVGVGSLYISKYFQEEDKEVADQMVVLILQEYEKTLNSTPWMNDDIKSAALARVSKTKKFIGYHQKLLIDSDHFYDNLFVNGKSSNDSQFLELGFAYEIFNSDREYNLLRLKDAPEDWTKYSRPATVNAYYNSHDNSIQFPAGILQRPIFDRKRLSSLNFGSIGSIIGHEITHAFDDFASRIDSKEYKKRVDCVIESFSANKVEIKENGQKYEIRLNGNRTVTEDIADLGGIKLSYNAFKNYQKMHPEVYTNLGGLNYTHDQLFFISYGEFHCNIERPQKIRKLIEEEVHSLSRFRVIEPLMNTKEFHEAFNCKSGDKMYRAEADRCEVW